MDFVNKMHCAYENLCTDEEGNPKEVTQPEMVEWMEMDRTQFTKWYKEAVKAGLTDLKKREANKKIGGMATFYRAV